MRNSAIERKVLGVYLKPMTLIYEPKNSVTKMYFHTKKRTFYRVVRVRTGHFFVSSCVKRFAAELITL